MDGLLLTINRDFLQNLERRGLQVGSLKIRYLIRDVGNKGHRYKPFDNLAAYNKAHASVLSSKNPYCSAGDFPIIENIEIINKNLNFVNSYKWFNITQKRTLVESIQYDSFRGEDYAINVSRYKRLMESLLNKYSRDITNAINIRLNSYVDPCYVDAGYVSPNSESIKSRSIRSILNQNNPTNTNITEII
jgi:hypothetical protein